jgi:hypothetical protein
MRPIQPGTSRYQEWGAAIRQKPPAEHVSGADISRVIAQIPGNCGYALADAARAPVCVFGFHEPNTICGIHFL